VTRDALRQALWTGDTFVDFDHGVNNSIKRIRDALGDSAESPHYIETLPRMGHRFIGSIDRTVEPSQAPSPSPGKTRRLLTVLALGGLVAAALTTYFLRKHIWPPPPPTLTIVPFTTFPGFEVFLQGRGRPWTSLDRVRRWR
jgi:hypothetical protein